MTIGASVMRCKASTPMTATCGSRSEWRSRMNTAPRSRALELVVAAKQQIRRARSGEDLALIQAQRHQHPHRLLARQEGGLKIQRNGGQRHDQKQDYEFKEPYTRRPIAMLKSSAFRDLSPIGPSVSSFLEAKLAESKGKDNGELPATYDDLVKYGIHRTAIGPAQREAIALGFVELTEHGRTGSPDYRRPRLFRLTYLPTNKGEKWIDPTNEWRSIETIDDAQKRAQAARRAPASRSKTSIKSIVRKTHFSVPETVLKPSTENVLQTPKSQQIL